MSTGTRDHIAGRVQVHIGGRGQRGFFAEIQESLTAIGELDGHETAAAQVTRCRVHHSQRVTHGYGRINGVAAAFQHIDTYLGG